MSYRSRSPLSSRLCIPEARKQPCEPLGRRAGGGLVHRAVAFEGCACLGQPLGELGEAIGRRTRSGQPVLRTEFGRGPGAQNSDGRDIPPQTLLMLTYFDEPRPKQAEVIKLLAIGRTIAPRSADTNDAMQQLRSLAYDGASAVEIARRFGPAYAVFVAINILPPPAKTYGDPTFTVSATASSG